MIKMMVIVMTMMMMMIVMKLRNIAPLPTSSAQVCFCLYNLFVWSFRLFGS